jgi:uncharacterized protein with PIN domain
MADETSDERCKDCGPVLTAFLEEMADQNKEQMELNNKVTCPTCGKVHEYTFSYPPQATVPPGSAAR